MKCRYVTKFLDMSEEKKKVKFTVPHFGLAVCTQGTKYALLTPEYLPWAKQGFHYDVKFGIMADKKLSAVICSSSSPLLTSRPVF